MRTDLLRRRLLAAVLAFGPLAGWAQEADLLQAQRTALAPLAVLDGLWRGPATMMQPDGRVIEIVQTERVGPMLGGTLRVIEGRGYLPDGTLQFNAFGVISFEPRTKAYTLRAHAQGRTGDFPLEVRPDGFSWSIAAGPAIIKYTATVKDGTWHEVGERLLPGQAAQRILEMTLRRVGGTEWPLEGAVPPR